MIGLYPHPENFQQKQLMDKILPSWRKTQEQLPRHETAQTEADSEAAPLHAQNASEEFSSGKKDGAEPRHRPQDAG